MSGKRKERRNKDVNNSKRERERGRRKKRTEKSFKVAVG